MDFAIEGDLYYTPNLPDHDHIVERIVDGYVKPGNLYSEIVSGKYTIHVKYDKRTYDTYYSMTKTKTNSKNSSYNNFRLYKITFFNKYDYNYFKTRVISYCSPNITPTVDNYNMRFVFTDYDFAEKLLKDTNLVGVYLDTSVPYDNYTYEKEYEDFNDENIMTFKSISVDALMSYDDENPFH